VTGFTLFWLALHLQASREVLDQFVFYGKLDKRCRILYVKFGKHVFAVAICCELAYE